MLTIRLQRVGKKNQAAFRIVLAEKQRAVKKMVQEFLGHYNPRTKEFAIKSQERLDYWIGQHVKLSPTVHNLLITKGLMKGEKIKSWRPKVKAAEAAAAPAQAGGQEMPKAEAPTTEPSPIPEPKVEEPKPADSTPAEQ